MARRRATSWRPTASFAGRSPLRPRRPATSRHFSRNINFTKQLYSNMRNWLATTLLALLTSGAICQTPSPDTATTRVLNSKLRVLIHDREAYKICAVAAIDQDSIVKLQQRQLFVQSIQLTDMHNLDSIRQSTIYVQGQQLTLYAQKDQIYWQQVQAVTQQLKKKSRTLVV